MSILFAIIGSLLFATFTIKNGVSIDGENLIFVSIIICLFILCGMSIAQG